MDQPTDTILIKDWITIGATIAGPILAVLATRVVDYVREKNSRRNGIFKTLMMTRMNKLSADHIGALNAIEIEFHDEGKVLNAWKNYLENLSADQTGMSEEGRKAHFAKRERLFAALVSQMAKVQKMKIEQLDILNENYFPQGWFDAEKEGRDLRQLLIALLRGNIMFPVHLDKSPHLKEAYQNMRDEHAKKDKSA